LLICSDASINSQVSNEVNASVQQPVSDIDLSAAQNLEAAGWCNVYAST